MIHRVLVLLGLAALAGCSSTPESIEVADQTNLISYPQVKANPQDNKERPARWGGVIAKVENLKEHTVLEVVSYPLRGYGKPKVGDDSEGRFRVYVDGFLDPIIYEKGRSVTVKGKVTGSEEGQVGDHTYQYPTLAADGHHLWRKTAPVQRVRVWGGAWGGAWGPWGNPYFHPWFGYRWGFPYHSRFVVRGGHPQVSGTRPIGAVSRGPGGVRVP